MDIYCAITHKSKDEASSLFSGQGYGFLKKTVLEAVLETILPIQKRFLELNKDPNYLMSIALKGAERARGLALKKMIDVRQKVGTH
jgi:tryptophanyl-tRNA synthetase